MIAVQGPGALATVQPLFDQPLEPVKYYHLTMGRLLGDVDRRGQPDRIHGRGRLRADRGGEPGRARLERASSNRARATASCPAGWERATRCGSRRPCRSTATSCPSDQPLRRRRGLGRQAGQGRVRRPRSAARLEAEPGPDAGRPAARRQADRPPGNDRARRRPRRSARSPPARSPRPCRRSLAMALVEPALARLGTPLDGRRPRPPRAGAGRGAAVLPAYSADSETELASLFVR